MYMCTHAHVYVNMCLFSFFFFYTRFRVLLVWACVYTRVYTTYMWLYDRVCIRIGMWTDSLAHYWCGERNQQWLFIKKNLILKKKSRKSGDHCVCVFWFVGSPFVPSVVRPSTVFAIAPQPRWGGMGRGERATMHTNCLEPLKVRGWDGMGYFFSFMTGKGGRCECIHAVFVRWVGWLTLAVVVL